MRLMGSFVETASEKETVRIETPPSETVAAEFANGSIYIDEPIFCRADINDDGDFADSEEQFYYTSNNLYCVTAVLDTSGNIIERYEYTPYGELTVYTDAASGTWWDGDETSGSLSGNYYTYTGRRSDPEAGLMYFRNRYYSPELGRFVSRDPSKGWHIETRTLVDARYSEFLAGMRRLSLEYPEIAAMTDEELRVIWLFFKIDELRSAFKIPAQYRDGMNLYASLRSNPVGFLDPFGLDAAEDREKCDKKFDWWGAVKKYILDLIGKDVPGPVPSKDDPERLKDTIDIIDAQKQKEEMIEDPENAPIPEPRDTKEIVEEVTNKEREED